MLSLILFTCAVVAAAAAVLFFLPFFFFYRVFLHAQATSSSFSFLQLVLVLEQKAALVKPCIPPAQIVGRLWSAPQFVVQEVADWLVFKAAHTCCVRLVDNASRAAANLAGGVVKVAAGRLAASLVDVLVARNHVVERDAPLRFELAVLLLDAPLLVVVPVARQRLVVAVASEQLGVPVAALTLA